MKQGRKKRVRTFRENAALYGSLIVFCLATDLLLIFPLMPELGASPIIRSSAPVSPRSAQDDIDIADYSASEDNPLIWPQHRIPNANFAPLNYSTLPPVTPITQTVSNYVVTLYPMYANTNLIVMTYTVKRLRMSQGYTTISLGPPLRAYSNNPSLVDEAGRRFPSVRHPNFHDYSLNRVVFDAQQLEERSPTYIRLHLVLDEVMVWVSESGSPSSVHEIKEPITFDLAMPVDRVRRIAEVNQTATTRDGDTITIEKVIATRHDVRIMWRLDRRYWPQYDSHSSLFEYRCCRLRLRAGNKSVTFWPQVDFDRVVHDHVAAGTFINEQGEWAVSAWYISNPPIDNIPPDQPGPVIRFIMPPAQNR